MKHSFSLSLALTAALLLACGGGTIQKKKDPEPIPEPKCGDARVDADIGEECDGSDLGGNSCTSLGFDLGTVSCDASCKVVTSQCVKLCGDGMIGPGEECDGVNGPLACAGWGYKACTSACKVDALHCRTESFGIDAPVSFPSGGVSLLTDLAPEGRGDLVTAQRSFTRLQTHEFDLSKGFVEGRKISGGAPLLPIAGDVDGDGHVDLAAINVDGTVDRFVFNGTSFPAEPFTISSDGGTPCLIERWIGAGALDAMSGTDFAALGCPSTTSSTNDDAVFIFHGTADASAPTQLDAPLTHAAALADNDGDGLLELILLDNAGEVTMRSAPDFAGTSALSLGAAAGAEAIAAGDLDGDGDADLVAASGAELAIFENTGNALAPQRTENVTALFPLVRDLDLDGKLDLAWIEDGKVQVRRNLGGFTFTPWAFDTGPGTPLGLSAGDAEGDGDPDLVASVSTSSSGPQSITYVLLNPVR